MRIFLIALLASLAAPCFAQHLGARVQWQPETADTDTRLQQPVQIEILGRAAVPAMQMLSEKTGVSLSVAPEDLSTVGERKLTIISKDLTLKALMVQLPEALQECHWDIDETGEQPVYLLHRNASVEATLKEQRAQRLVQYKAERAAARLSRLEAARQALQMSSPELARLEETDLFLARAVQEPTARAIIETFLSLPDRDMAQFANAGRLQYRHDEAPPQIESIARLLLEQLRHMLSWVESWPAEEQRPPGFEDRDWGAYIEQEALKIEHSPDTLITLSDEGVELGGILLIAADWCGMIIPAQYVWEVDRGVYEHFLLAQTGDDSARALDALKKSRRKLEALAESHDRDDSQWIEPSDPRLQYPICWTQHGDTVSLLDFQQAVAAQTGMSIVSDSFGSRWAILRDDLRESTPLWRLLALLSKRAIESKAVGDCLVFHHKSWYRLSQEQAATAELVEDFRQRLQEQGHFTLEDVVEFAVEVESRLIFHVCGGESIPSDLIKAGVFSDDYPRRPLLFYHALTPEEKAMARSPDGLSFANLWESGRARLTNDLILLRGEGDRAWREKSLRSVRFFLTESTGEENGSAYTAYDFRFVFSEDADVPEHLFSTEVRLPEIPPTEKTGGDHDCSDDDGVNP